jgi:uncharacterized integral membrane protein
MKIDNTELLKSPEAISINLLRLIMLLIMACQTVATGLPAKAHHSPKILRQLGDAVRGQLMQLHLIFKQDLGESRMRWHSKLHGEKLLKNYLVTGWL